MYGKFYYRYEEKFVFIVVIKSVHMCYMYLETFVLGILQDVLFIAI